MRLDPFVCVRIMLAINGAFWLALYWAVFA